MDKKALQKLLLTVLKKNTFSELLFANFADSDWSELTKLAKKQHVLNIVYLRLKENNLQKIVPDEILLEMQKSFEKLTMNNLRLKGEFNKLVNEMQKQDIPVIALKGMFLTYKIYPYIGLRFMRDLDILVPVNKAHEAYSVAQSLGYQSENINEEHFSFFKEHHLLQMINRSGSILEIHGNIISPGKNYSVSPDIFWQNSKKVKMDNTEFDVLDPIDLILHLCIHISYQDIFYTDLRHYYDLLITLNHYSDKIDWNEFNKRCYERKWQKGVFFVFKLLNEMFEFKIPAIVENSFKETITYIPGLLQNAIEIMWEYDRSKENFDKHNLYSNHLEAYKNYIEGSFSHKIKVFLKRIFLSKSDLIYQYSLPEKSFKVYFYYFLRFFDLLFEHKSRLFKLSTDKSFGDFIAKKVTFYEWLNKS